MPVPSLFFPRNHPPIALAILGTLYVPSAVQASAPGFSSDRPAFSNATAVAPKHELITEFGLSVAPFAAQPEAALPEMSFRMGLNSWLELRWRSPSLLLEGSRNAQGEKQVVMNLGKPSVGFKAAGALSEQVQASTSAEISLPLGSGLGPANRSDFMMNMNLNWQPLERLTLNPTAAFGSRWVGAEATGRRLMSAAASLAGWWQFNDRLSGFALLYSWFGQEHGDNLQGGLGVAWMLRPHVQLDASLEMPLLTEIASTRMGLGCTWYWAGRR